MSENSKVKGLWGCLSKIKTIINLNENGYCGCGEDIIFHASQQLSSFPFVKLHILAFPTIRDKISFFIFLSSSQSAYSSGVLDTSKRSTYPNRGGNLVHKQPKILPHPPSGQVSPWIYILVMVMVFDQALCQ